MKPTASRISREMKMLSRYMGMKISRYVICVLLMLCYAALSPVCMYIAFTSLILPPLIHVLISSGKKENTAFHLQNTMERFRFTKKKYQSENIATPILIFFMLAWQYILSMGDNPMPWKVVPGFLLCVMILLRIVITLIVKLYIHKQFTSLKALD